MPNDLTRQDIKEVMKEGLKEWLDQQFSRVGRWTCTAFSAIILAGVVYFAVSLGTRGR